METSQDNFSAKDVMTLRAKTGVGMMDCKKALAATGGDMTAAEEWLRQHMKGKIAARTEQATSQGLIGIAIDGARGAIVEIRTQTDFGARSPEYVAMVSGVAKLALKGPAGPVKVTADMTRLIDDVSMTTREAVKFARGEKLEGGAFGKYIHHDGKRAALIQVSATADDTLLTGICQHIVAHDPAPIGVSEADVPAATLDRVRREAQQEAAESGKPAEIAQKIAEGKVRKFLGENTLLDQVYVKDAAAKSTIRQILPKGVTVKRFVRYTLGAD
jgi:elongation factor Ts